MSKKTSEWEKEFDEIFVKGFRLTKIQQQNVRTIKSFISDLLAKEKMELVERIEGIDTKKHICRFNDGEQNCECYLEGISALKSEIQEKEEER